MDIFGFKTIAVYIGKERVGIFCINSQLLNGLAQQRIIPSKI